MKSEASELDLSSIAATESSQERSHPTTIVVCRGRSCRKYDAAKVFEQVKQQLPPEMELISVPCLGQCGNGPMILVESEQVWYSEVHPDEVATIVQQHLIGNSPVTAMLYPKFHPQQ